MLQDPHSLALHGTGREGGVLRMGADGPVRSGTWVTKRTGRTPPTEVILTGWEGPMPEVVREAGMDRIFMSGRLYARG